MPSPDTPVATPFLGLVPFLRMSNHGTDLRPVAQELLARAETCPDDANLWMNLATVMLSLNLRDVGLNIQAQALAMQRVFYRAAAHQPARLRVLLLMAPGDLAANMPLDCLLEDSDIELMHYFVSAGEQPLATPLPEHDLAMVAMSESDANRPLLEALMPILAAWPRPVLNRPQAVLNTDRERASQLLQGVPGLLMPPTLPVERSVLLRIASGETPLNEALAGLELPVIIRPVGSHAGHGLERIADCAALGDYLQGNQDRWFFVSPFIDYRDADGQFRKYRVALVDGVPYASHMGISSHWMIHYLNAGMYEDAAKRGEENAWMEGFADFARRHATALAEIHRRSGLDYVCIDCAQTRDGELLVFEIGHAMVVHATDPVALFPYKQVYMHKVKSALRDYLLRRANVHDRPAPHEEIDE